MTNTTKVTKRDYFNQLATIVENNKNDIPNYEDVKAFISHEIELLNRKRSGSKPTKTQIENENIKKKIVQALQDINEVVTISELNGVEGLEEYSNQKLSALTNALVKEGKVVKTTVKKVSYFKIA
jgi:formate dehydrogenase maturation protein FdhE